MTPKARAAIDAGYGAASSAHLPLPRLQAAKSERHWVDPASLARSAQDQRIGRRAAGNERIPVEDGRACERRAEPLKAVSTSPGAGSG